MWKLLVLQMMQVSGAFALARRLTRRRVRVLCYHGAWLRNEDQFGDKLFMRPETFAARMELLARLGYRVVPLDEAMDMLEGRRPPEEVVAITIDDGWYSTYAAMLPVLERHRFPATIYVTTSHVRGQSPVFNLLIQYLVKRSALPEIDLSAFSWARYLVAPRLRLAQAGERLSAIAALNEVNDRLGDPATRLAMARDLATGLRVPIDELLERRIFHMMSPGEIRDAGTRGFDIQLHTHRHTMGDFQSELLSREILENREVLADILECPPGHLRHFCYPSGRTDPAAWPVLDRLGVVSATTIEFGLNPPGIGRFAIRRVLDGESLSPLEFEAMLSGFYDLMAGPRAWLGRIRRRLHRQPADPGSPLRAPDGRTNP
ncbi:MAG: polysaccharide deacetylase family protein [Alphaproteobacteria bacterium]|nr:polysaccharide deacetylase family protein [Alphaproteobacteria bacterium]